MPSQVKIEELDESEKRDKSEDKDKGKSRERKSSRPSGREDASLRNRLDECFARLAESLEARDDHELADVVREDAKVMANGLVSLTRFFRPLRLVVVLLVAIVEPLLAFGRIARVLAERWAMRRAERAAAREAEARGAAYPPDAR